MSLDGFKQLVENFKSGKFDVIVTDAYTLADLVAEQVGAQVGEVVSAGRLIPEGEVRQILIMFTRPR